MPTYRYRCGTCGEEFEVWQSIKDPSLTIHRESVPDSICDGALVKVLSPAGIVLKGSGFYKTDSRSNGRSGSRQDKRETSSSDSGSSSSDTTTSDAKQSDAKKSESSGSDAKKAEPKKSDSGAKKSESSKQPSSSKK